MKKTVKIILIVLVLLLLLAPIPMKLKDGGSVYYAPLTRLYEVRVYRAMETDENGTDHFYSHGKISKKIAFDALTRLKTSAKFRNHVCDLVEFHDFLPDKIRKKTYKKYIARLGLDTIKELFEIRKADVSAQNPKFFAESLKENETGLKVLEEIEKENACFTLADLAIGGRELAEIGFKPSPAMGKVLETLLDEVMDEKIENTKEVLLKRAEELEQN